MGTKQLALLIIILAVVIAGIVTALVMAGGKPAQKTQPQVPSVQPPQQNTQPSENNTPEQPKDILVNGLPSEENVTAPQIPGA